MEYPYIPSTAISQSGSAIQALIGIGLLVAIAVALFFAARPFLRKEPSAMQDLRILLRLPPRQNPVLRNEDHKEWRDFARKWPTQQGENQLPPEEPIL